MYLFLFDIDGTLIDTGGAGKRALEQVFKEIYEIEGAMDGIKPYGKTDAEIVREILEKKVGIKDADEGLINIILDTYVRYLQEFINNPKYRILPGVEKFIKLAATTPGNLLGIATGNIELGAKIKLKRSGLLRYFKFGAYSSDVDNRVEILKLAAKRGKRLALEEVERIYVIGDTPRDIEAAREAGFIPVAVATGSYGISELFKAGPDYLFNTLEDRDAIKLLKGWHEIRY